MFDAYISDSEHSDLKNHSHFIDHIQNKMPLAKSHAKNQCFVEVVRVFVDSVKILIEMFVTEDRSLLECKDPVLSMKQEANN